MHQSLLEELFITVEKIGIDNTVKTLKEARNVVLESVEYGSIIKIVSDKTGVPVEVILTGNDRSDERKIALSLSVYFVKEHFPEYSFKDMIKIFGKDSSCLWRYHNNVLKLPKKPKLEFEVKLASLMKEIELLITREKSR